jgi:predicted NBD/HSP70 family sugar kinase
MSSDRQTPVSLRTLGRVRVLQALSDAAGMSRPELVQRTGLARATVGSVVADLLAAGLLAEDDAVDGDRPSRIGRPPRTLALAAHAAYAFGVDIGHDRVHTQLCDLHGEPVWDQTTALAVDEAAPEVLALVSDHVDTALPATGIGRAKVLGIGIGIATPVDHVTGTLHAAGIMPGWVGVRPADELRARTGLAARVVNDANAAVLGERRYGAAQRRNDAIYLRLSAGIGTGVVCDGRLLLGSGGLAGEVGHVTVAPDGLVCRCGNRGCLETVASPDAVAALLSTGRQRPVTVDDLLDLVRAGDRGAVRVVEDAGVAVGRAMAGMVMALNPGLIVVGGVLAAAGEPLFSALRTTIARNAMNSHTEELQIVPSTLGDNAGVRGAAALVLADAPERLAVLSAG